MPNVKTTKQAFSHGISGPNPRNQNISGQAYINKSRHKRSNSKMVVGMGKNGCCTGKNGCCMGKNGCLEFPKKQTKRQTTAKHNSRKRISNKQSIIPEKGRKKLSRKLENMKGRKPKAYRLENKHQKHEHRKAKSPKPMKTESPKPRKHEKYNTKIRESPQKLKVRMCEI